MLDGLALQYEALRRMLGSEPPGGLQRARRSGRPTREFDYKARFRGAPRSTPRSRSRRMKRNLVRCVSFALGGFDTHGNNYRNQAQIQQELFDIIAALVQDARRDAAPDASPARSSRTTRTSW